jgi:dethiobiotin synthetase
MMNRRTLRPSRRGAGNNPGLFFTGTDTGVGKTFVTSWVAHFLYERGHVFGVCKPVATGASRDGAGWLSEDTVALARAAGLSGDWARVTPWAFADPVAPPVAARRSGTTLTLPLLADAVRRCAPTPAPVLVEGIGGLLCPVTEHETVADLAALLGLAVVVVARRSLGTLNHTLLTLEAARSRGLRLAGVVVNETTPCRGLAEETNVEELRRRVGEPILAVVRHQAGPAEVEQPGLAAVDWWELCHS